MQTWDFTDGWARAVMEGQTRHSSCFRQVLIEYRVSPEKLVPIISRYIKINPPGHS